MSQHRAAEFFKAVKKDQALQSRVRATSDPKAFIQIASERGYHFTEDDLESALDQISEAELASLFNPGVGGRERIVPR